MLKSLPLNIKVPLLLEWQSSVEIDRVLGLRWKDVLPGVKTATSPLELIFYGRKKHRKRYSPLLGQDSLKHLRLWRSVWTEGVGREPAPEDMIFLGKSKNGAGPRPMSIKWLNDCMKTAASRLFSQGLIENGDPTSWHSHYLRHSFSTECSHAGVKPEVREYWMEHLSGISWVYQHPELHRQDLVEEYRKVEPFVSLDYSETTMREEFDEERKSWITEIASLRMEVARFAGSSSRGPPAAGGSKAAQPEGS